MIPEAAVEAAARHLAFYTDRPGTDWAVESRALLEAMAPLMPIPHMKNEDLHRMGINRCPGCVARTAAK